MSRMQKTILKETFREVRRSLGRFLAILILILLGVTFFVGFNAMGPDLSASATRYFAQSHFHNYRILSTIGFDNDDVQAIRSLKETENAQAFYTLDAIETYGGQSGVAHVMSLPESVDTLTVVRGRLPQSADECVVDEQKNGTTPRIGQTVTLTSGTDDDLSQKLHQTAFRVVGVVNSPSYLARDRGTSKIGNGKVSGLLFVQSGVFSLPAYTEVDVTAKGMNGLSVFSTPYYQKAAELGHALEKLAPVRTQVRHDELVNDANAQLADQQNAYDTQKAQADQALADAQAQIDGVQSRLDAAQVQLTQAEKQADAQMSATQAQIDSASDQLAEKTAAYQQGLVAYDQQAAAAQPKIDQAEQGLSALAANLQTVQAQQQALQAALSSGQADGSLSASEAQQMNVQLAALQQNMDALTQQQSAAQASLNTQQQQLAAAKSQLDETKRQLDASSAQLANQQAAFASAQKQSQDTFAQKQKELDAQKTTLEQSRQSFAAQQADTDQKLNDVAAQIADAKQRIADIEMPQWSVLSRDKNAGYTNLKSTLDRNNGISSILPILFFSIAALVCLTSMTRMVEERRTQIGTLKALGYGNGSILSQYLFYAGAASALGSAAGIVLGLCLLPRMLFHAYMSMFTMPVMDILAQPGIAAAAAGIALSLILFATAITCMGELRAVPSALLRPEAPKAGKRILLERIPFIWEHLSFSRKVTVRNLFRYKKRFWMTVLGVACCCAMLVSGFGLYDSISTQVSAREFGGILKYSLTVQMKDDASASQIADVAGALQKTSGVASLTENTQKTVTAKNGAASQQCSLMVPQQPAKFSDYIALRSVPGGLGKSGSPLSLTDSGVIITQQLAKNLGLKQGDTLTVQDDDTHSHRFRVSGIAENYLMNDVFITPAAYQDAYGSAADVNQLLVNLKAGASQNTISENAMKMDGVASVSLLSDLKQTFSDTVKSLNGMVAIVIFSALLLAAVVLFTLTSINIAERFREIATIKVLGFYDREVSGYVTRESYILTLIGIALGCAGGIVLHARILDAISVNNVMFVRSILPQSFLISAALTLVFTWLINLLAMRAMQKIDMVEALKGTE